MDVYNCTEGVFALGGASTGAEGAAAGAAAANKPPPGQILVSLALSAVAVMTTAINSVVIAAIVVTRKLHHPANYLICSLATTDLLVAVLVMPFSIVYIQKKSWAMGQLVCSLWLSVDITCCTCSILHLAAIALDRYRAITDAVEYARKRTGRRAGLTVGVVWLLAALISLPPMLWRHHDRRHTDEDQCVIVHRHMAFTLYSTLGAFYIPLMLILVLYYKIYRAAQTLYLRREASRASRRSCLANGSLALPSAPATATAAPAAPAALAPPEKSSDPSTEGERARIAVATPTSPRSELRRRRRSFRQEQRISGSRERRAASTLGLILGAFVVCWLPFFLKEVIVNTCGGRCGVSTATADFLTWLGYLNSLINPLIYTIFNEDFKKAFQRLVRCRHSL